MHLGAVKHWWQNIIKEEVLPESTNASSSSKKLVAWWSMFYTQSGLTWVLSCGQEGIFVWSDGREVFRGMGRREGYLPSLFSALLGIHYNFWDLILKSPYSAFCSKKKMWVPRWYLYMCSDNVNSMLSKVCAFACFLYPQKTKTYMSRFSKQNTCRK